MQDYDVTLKSLLLVPAARAKRMVARTEVTKWLDVELPKVQNLRLDLLGETADGGLIQVELQSANDPAMPLRMAEYALGVFRLLRRFPRQIVLYVGDAAASLEAELRASGVLFQYEVIDIRTLDAEELLQSREVGDNVIAVLARLRDHRGRRILRRIAGLPFAQRATAIKQLLILAGLRRWAHTVVEETENMPMHIDLMENDYLGPILLKKMEEGRQEGKVAILRRQLEKRFGALPVWATEKLAGMPASALEALSERVLDTGTLEELLG